MRRDTQLWLAGSIVVAIAVASVVVINQRAQISDQRESLDQQSQLTAELKERSDEAARLRQQETNFALQLKALDAEQARNAASAAADQASQAASEQRAQERQRLEAQIQDLKVQRERLARQTTCTQIQTGLRSAERNGDETQTKALQERWNATCTSG
jgi:preprotein translocase subunit SecF